MLINAETNLPLKKKSKNQKKTKKIKNVKGKDQ